MPSPLISRHSDALHQLSSGDAYFQKRIAPIFFFGFVILLNLFAALGAVAMIKGKMESDGWPFLATPAFMLVIGYLYYLQVADIADEVVDAGDCLIVRRDDVEARIPMADIAGVATAFNSRRVVLRLRADSPFGHEIGFLAAQEGINPFASNPIVDDLTKRIEWNENAAQPPGGPRPLDARSKAAIAALAALIALIWGYRRYEQATNFLLHDARIVEVGEMCVYLNAKGTRLQGDPVACAEASDYVASHPGSAPGYSVKRVYVMLLDYESPADHGRHAQRIDIEADRLASTPAPNAAVRIFASKTDPSDIRLALR